jgi:hypothetical protein
VSKRQLILIGLASSEIWIGVSNACGSPHAGVLRDTGAARREAVPVGGQGKWWARRGHIRGSDHLQSWFFCPAARLNSSNSVFLGAMQCGGGVLELVEIRAWSSVDFPWAARCQLDRRASAVRLL